LNNLILFRFFVHIICSYTIKPSRFALPKRRFCSSDSIFATLDRLLDFCFFEPMVQLFRRLCRYYYDIDPNATASYVYTYREMWDSEEPKDSPPR